MASSYFNKQIGNYCVVNELASGSFGRVYLAHHLYLTNRTVAIKILHASHLGSSEDRENFLREAQFLERLKHPYILAVLDFGIDEEFPYLVTEYVPNGSLRDQLKRLAPHLFPLQESLTILTQIGQALQFAHSQQIIHRDLKPENILFNSRNEALLADFGLATMLTTTSIKYVNNAGTPRYMAPEQFHGTISKESDQYALACIAYELFTGRPPFITQDVYAVGFKHLFETPVPPTQINSALPVSLDPVILKAMAKQRSDRYPSVFAFITALQQCVTSQPYPMMSSSLDGPTISGTSTSGPLDTSTKNYFQTAFSSEGRNNHDGISQKDTEQSTHRSNKGNTTLDARYSNERTSQQDGKTATPFSSLQEQTSEPHNSPTGNFLATPSTNSMPSIDQFKTANVRQPGQETLAAISTPVPSLPSIHALGETANNTHTTPVTAKGAIPTSPIIEISASTQVSDQQPKKRSRWIFILAVCLVVIASTTGVILLPTAFSRMASTRTTSSANIIPTSITGQTGVATLQTTVTSGPNHKLTRTSTKTTKPTASTTSVIEQGTPGPYATSVSSQPTPIPTSRSTSQPDPTPPPSSVTITVPFSYGNVGVQTSQSYSGTITITVSGSGKASQTASSDAFYIYTDNSGNPLSPPQHPSCYMLYIDGASADTYTSLPAYSSGHRYTFKITAPGGKLIFSECDSDPTGDRGAYTITITTS